MLSRLVRGLSIRAGLLGFTAGTVAVLLVVCAAAWIAVTSLLASVERESAAQSVQRARAVFERRGIMRRAIAREYGWWTETWEYIGHPTAPSAGGFLRENFLDWMPAQYGDRYVAIRARDHRPLLLWTDSAASSVGPAFDSQPLFDLLDRQRSVGGLWRTPRGLYLVGAAVVVPTNAAGGQGPSRGYLVFGAPVTDTLLAQMSAELQQGLSLGPLDSTLAGDAYRRRVIAGGDSVEVQFVLADLLRGPLATVSIRSSRAFAVGLEGQMRVLSIGALLVSGAALALLWIGAELIAVRPTRRIAAALVEMRTTGHFTPIATEAPSSEWGTMLSAFNTTVEVLRSYEAQLSRAQKMEALGTLVGGVAHEFNNLMGAVLASANIAKAELEPDHPAQPSLESIERATRRTAELARQLLGFARRDHLLMTPLSLNHSVRNIALLCGRTFDRAIRVDSRLASGLLPVRADASQIEQVLLNLCINAKDAMPQGGVLSLDTRVVELDAEGARGLSLNSAGPYAVVTVGDTGTGIDPAVQRRMFEPFFTTKPGSKGSGLGLAMVYGMVGAHGGGVAVESEPGRGARFDVYLPLSDEPLAEAKPELAGKLARGTETILLVDDERDLRRVLSRGLRRLGYRVIEAENGQEALDRFREHRDEIALIILDLQMPVMGGLEALRLLRDLSPHLPIAITSGYSEQVGADVLSERGAVAFLPKPCEFAELADTIRGAIDAAAVRPAPHSELLPV